MQLAQAIAWSYFDNQFGKLSPAESGRPPLPPRLLVGLHYLKSLYNESDESTVAKWVENPYWQFFCGEQYFRHDLPCHPTTLVNWRQRIGADGMEKLLKQVLQAAQQQQALKSADVKRVIVDTTVQEKAVAFPTDARLYDKARRALVREAHKRQLKLRQSVECIAKGKVHKKYEFGCKVAVVTTNESNWIVGIEAKHGNPYDGATLKPALVQVEKLTGVKPEEAFVDQGFRGSNHHPEGVSVYLSGKRKLKGKVKTLLKRRSAIEPVIGHGKQDHGMGRNYLRGKAGDQMNALLSGCGFNLRKLWRFFAARPLTNSVALA